jgi:hypothetical protein
MPITMEPHSGPSLIGMLKEAFEAAKIPGKVFKEGMTSDDMIKAGNDFALTVGTGGSLVPKPGNSLGIFGGRLAKTANHKMLESAERLERAGATPDSIWKATGWGRGKDGRWRFEINDAEAKLNSPITHRSKHVPAERAVDHPELFEAYPQLKTLGLGPLPETSRAYGSYDGVDINISPGIGPDEQRKTLLHELQHGVQYIEGFAKGGNPGMFTNDKQWDVEITKINRSLGLIARRLDAETTPIKEKQALSFAYNQLTRLRSSMVDRSNPYTKYKRLAGEAESRNVENRMNLTPIEQAMRSPWVTEDVPRKLQKVIGR